VVMAYCCACRFLPSQACEKCLLAAAIATTDGLRVRCAQPECMTAANSIIMSDGVSCLSCVWSRVVRLVGEPLHSCHGSAVDHERQ
jgi:hypothetical protein